MLPTVVPSLLPKHQRRGCHTHHSESVPSWCWRGRPECPGGTRYRRTVAFRKRADSPQNLILVCPSKRTHPLSHIQGVRGLSWISFRTRNDMMPHQWYIYTYYGISHDRILHPTEEQITSMCTNKEGPTNTELNKITQTSDAHPQLLSICELQGQGKTTSPSPLPSPPTTTTNQWWRWSAQRWLLWWRCMRNPPQTNQYSGTYITIS